MKHFGKSHKTYLILENGSGKTLKVQVSQVDNYDWDGKSRPDHDFQGAVIKPNSAFKARQEINAKSRSAMSTMKFLADGRQAFSMRIDQWAALADNRYENEFKLENGWKAHMTAGIDGNTLKYRFTKA